MKHLRGRLDFESRETFSAYWIAMKPTVLTLLGAALFLSGCGQQASHDTFQDCFLNKISATPDEFVAGMLRQECANKYQAEMPQTAVSKLVVSLDPKSTTFFINIRNGNDEWTLTEIEFSETLNPATAPERHRETFYIEPLRSGFTSASTRIPEESVSTYSWVILKAWGVRRGDR